MPWIPTVLRFWFEELQPQQWFTKDERVDALIRDRFGPVYEEVRALDPQTLDTPEACLAAVIVLDQFPRNMFRGQAQAFATDAQALSISRHAIERGFDAALSQQQRMFLLMPWQHCEDRDAQVRSVALFESLGLPEPLDYARQHLDVIERFGRFPHRNAALQRDSTDAERDFVRTHPGF